MTVHKLLNLKLEDKQIYGNVRVGKKIPDYKIQSIIIYFHISFNSFK